MKILQEEARLDEIVRLVGMDALSPSDRLTMECAKSVREDYLHQNAFHEIDTYASLPKQMKMLRLIIDWYEVSIKALGAGANVNDILAVSARDGIGRAKYITEDELDKIDELNKAVKEQVSALAKAEVK